ncbi:MAG: PAS domain S-box protein, partial [Vicinamibacterales bacterium]
DAIFLLDGDRIVECNPGTVELFGHSRDTILGRSPVAFSPAVQPDGERSAEKAARLIKAASEGEPQRFEWRHVQGNEREYDAEVTLNRVELANGSFVQAIVHDITDRKTSEARTAREALRYRTLMQAALDGIHILDRDGNLLEANDRFYALLGYDPDDAPRLNVADWDAQWGRDQLLDEIGQDLRTARVFETMHRRADGTTVPVEVSAIGVDLGNEQVLYCAARDISARKLAEEERASLQRSLLQAQKMESVGRLAGGVAHDFNNLLTVISGYASLLEADAERHPGMAAKAGEIVRATNRASELTRKLLIFSRRHPDEPKVIAIDDFLRQEARMVPRLIGEHITVVPSPGAEGVRVRIDPAQLAQVLMNLVVNARDAMPEGGTLTLRTRRLQLGDEQAARHPGARPGEHVCLSVDDTGTGMSADVQAHLFEPFFTTKEVGRGTGLGLATAYGIVKQAGGFIDVESEPGRGTSMQVVLPATDHAGEHERAEQAPQIVGGRERVLVVEDEATVRELTRTCLERLGYSVIATGSPVEALSLAHAGAVFDLVVSDVVMPGMNGHRLVQELRALRSGFEVLFVSGFADTGVAGTTDVTIDPKRFLPKPFSPAALGHRVRSLLDQRVRDRG